jgi:Ca2+-binding EF-hand superfamily protein
LFDLDKTLTREELFSTVIALDEDGSGNISLDEFLNYFG